MKNLQINLLVLLFTFLSFSSSEIYASHIPGANLTYTCDPANPLTYTFTLTAFVKCPSTHPTTMASSYFTLTNTCGEINPAVPIFNQTGVAEDVNQLCSTATSNCSGGTDPGVWKYTYEATITFPADCDSWNLAFELCCRDASSNLTGTTGNDMACSTTMNTLTAPCNSSPVVTAQPIPYACTNTNFNYCLTIADPEGDSTYFSMVAPAGNAQTAIASLAGYSATTPLTNFTLDPLTGCMSFNEPNVGNYVVAVQINSFDAAGNLIATIIHDFQFIVLSCTNTPPTNPVGGIGNVSGTGSQVGPNTVSACFGDNICFDVVFQDLVDPGNVITIQQDGTTLLPGATFTQTGTNPATGTFCWVSQPGFTGNVVTFIAEDDGCPVLGTSGFAVNFNITTGVYAGSDETICGAQSVPIAGYGSGSYSWSPAAGLSCTNCANPIATPASTTTYTVTGNLTGVCSNTDQVTVNVVPDFTLNMNPANATICANEIVQLNANGQAGFGPFIYDWDNTSTLNMDSIINPLANPLTSTLYTATVTAANGCTKDVTANVIISGVGPTVAITPLDTTICIGESVPYTSTAFVYPVVCGLSSGCSGTNSFAEVGVGTSATTSYTPFYGSTSTTTNYTSKSQYIYTAAELNALGYFGGTIESLSLFFTTSNTYQYDNVEIYIACTSQDEFTSTTFTPVSTMTQVFTGNNINPTDNGWHTFNITDWDWDGSSNLIIQMCAQEDNTNDEGSESVRYTTTTPAYRCIYDHTTVAASPSCDELTGSRTTLRPNMRFDICSESPVTPTYSWTTTTGLNNPSIANPTATPGVTTSYVLDVTASGCTGSRIAQITIENSNAVLASNDTTVCATDPAFLNSVFSGPIPTTIPCGMATGPCAGANTTAVVGTGTTSSSTYGPFYGSSYDVKYQFLYTAAELTAMGFQSGTITSIAFNIATKNSTGAFNGFTIRMGCTNTDFLLAANGWEPTSGVVYGPTNYTTTAGWNTFNLTTGFDWDGTSNIVIETCFDNAASVGSDSYFYTATTGFDRTMREYNNTGPGCANAPSYDYPYHPNLRLTICDPPPFGLTYNWTPAATLNNPNIANPTATPIVPTTYLVSVTGGICTAYDTVEVDICSVLPVEMVSFNATCKNSKVVLDWTTAGETNNDYFIIERSDDAIKFAPIGTVNGAGNNTTTINYNWEDNNPLTGNAYYRLKQVDFDGEVQYHEIASVNCKQTGIISIYPNPFKNNFTVELGEITDYPLTIEVLDYLGRVVYNKQTENNLTVIAIEELPAGTYFIKVFNDNTQLIERIVKMK